ncbi:heme/hemin ABC transporter substrate-binding protein [Pseudoroseicyclus aestuarii]|uniref:Iron complex transport system substrate-binding protein n=1 Tax=Pseudoroseicyclus aestuarii TaxID=1795041 RepID=A0A318SMX8_9RHOB|nr:ABC transporter substrate-binding protein [Pseudoroseicyclus aestuarii]PYE81313.1 iron complex transport system substrate-binding protein [Pseudoroseicyclus aestuarii]
MRRRAVLAVLALLAAGRAGAEQYPDTRQIVSIGGPITEIVYALGQQNRLVARDTTSTYPEAATDLPDVGYMRQLSPEGVLSVGPDLILARETSGPPETMQVLGEAGIPVVLVPDRFDAEGVSEAVRMVGDALGEADAAEAMAQRIEAQFAALRQGVEARPDALRVLFVLSVDGGRLNVAGSGTGADGLLSLAGGTNVMGSAFGGYKLITDEALIEAAPDAILMMDSTGDHSLADEAVLTIPAVTATPAGQAGRVVRVPDWALGFGPRTPEAARDLHDALFGTP